MSLTLTLESFDDESVAAQKSHPEFTRGFEEGIAAGRQEAELAQGNLSAALVGAIADTGFTFAEARQSVLADLEPLLTAITTQILPATQTIGLATTICEILQSAAKAELPTQPVITVHPENVDAMLAALGDVPARGVKILTDPTLTTHAAWLSMNGHSSAIDFENTFAAVRTALRAYSDPLERTINHG